MIDTCKSVEKKWKFQIFGKTDWHGGYFSRAGEPDTDLTHFASMSFYCPYDVELGAITMFFRLENSWRIKRY